MSFHCTERKIEKKNFLGVSEYLGIIVSALSPRHQEVHVY